MSQTKKIKTFAESLNRAGLAYLLVRAEVKPSKAG